MPTVILFIGQQPRSGHSLATGIAQRLGVFIGREEDLAPADEWNPGGHGTDMTWERFGIRQWGLNCMEDLARFINLSVTPEAVAFVRPEWRRH